MSFLKHNLLLADDDTDDVTFFKEALNELPVEASLSTVNDGVQLMHYLTSTALKLPDLLYLDLNMPLKSGVECLDEIKQNDTIKQLPVIIFTTAFNMEVVDLVYQKGAHYFIRKPGEYSQLKKIIYESLTLITKNQLKQPPREEFILQP